MTTIQKAVNQIKLLFERAIINGGEKGKLALIRSSIPIKLIHEAVKSEFVNNGISENQIFPPLGESRGEVKISGLLKNKDQDITIFPTHTEPKPEMLNYGLLTGQTDILGKEFVERILSVNIRSQLSSLEKNFDTLYERTFAESLNLHLRCPKMCLGEVYMIPVYEYDTKAAQDHSFSFLKKIGNVSKYLLAFDAIAERNSTENDFYKYEKICLLIVDFSQETPKIYSSDEELKADGLLAENSFASISNLTFTQFVPGLLEIYKARFGRLP